MRSAVGRADHLSQLRRELVVVYRRSLHDAADHGAFFAATMGHTTEAGVFGASALGFLAPLPVSDDGEVLTEVEAMSGALAEPPDGEATPERSVVELGIGPGRAHPLAGELRPGRL